ncbi:hypothetical protein ZIOFF_071060 [Zingiber officinale]|uniref:THH1/TOM1/TOM3 domain-containing protein n=1 Tax=Zingiber officinale TaxID=94328 RepID=A0A8J5EQ85_ZINOF|nr:hypothetical protein ZIOFF_071060 [Zingiber officinale]
MESTKVKGQSEMLLAALLEAIEDARCKGDVEWDSTVGCLGSCGRRRFVTRVGSLAGNRLTWAFSCNMSMRRTRPVRGSSPSVRRVRPSAGSKWLCGKDWALGCNRAGEKGQLRPQFFSDISFYDFVSPQIQLIRIQLRVPGTGWTTQKVFHLMNFVVSGLRAVLFGLYQDVFLIKSKALEMALLDLPSLLFFSTYTLLVLFWAEIYYQARNLPINNLRRSYLIINGAVYIIQICIWAYVQISRKPVLMEVAKLFLSVVSFLAALAFLIYGGRLFIMLRRFPIESKGRQKKLNEVSLSVFDHDADLDVLDHPVFNFIYYMLVEIFPCALVLFILRKLPPKRFSGAYNPIN